MDNRVLNLIVAYEEELKIPEEKRTTRYSEELRTNMIKDETAFEKAKLIRNDVLTLMGYTLDDFATNEKFADKEFVKASVQNAVRPIRIASESLEVVEIFNKPVLFTNERLKLADVPDGMFKYDIRHDDDCQGDMVELKDHVMVNHWATVICKEPFDITQEFDGHTYTTADGITMTADDYNYTGEVMTIEQYVNSYDELLRKCNQDIEQTSDEMGGMSMG